MDKHGAFALRRDRQEQAQDIRRDAWPDRTLKFRDHVAEAGAYLHFLLGGNVDVVAFYFKGDAELAKSFGKHRYGGAVAALYGYGVLGRGRQGYKARDLDVVGVYRVLAALQFRDALDYQPVAADAGNVGAHFVEHKAELLHVRLAGRVVDDGLPGGEDGSHDEVFRAGHRRFVEQHVSSPEPAAVQEHEPVLVIVDGDSQTLQAGQVGGYAPGADLVAARQGKAHLSAAEQQRRGQTDGGPDLGEVFFRDLAGQDALGGHAPGVRIFFVFFDLRAQRL